jgi:hypothetical protein
MIVYRHHESCFTIRYQVRNPASVRRKHGQSASERLENRERLIIDSGSIQEAIRLIVQLRHPFASDATDELHVAQIQLGCEFLQWFPASTLAGYF